MFIAITWITVASLLALWSLAAWALHAAGVWAVSNAGALSGVATGVEGLRLPQWLASWVPPEIAQSMAAMLAELAVLLDGVLQSAPALAGGVSVVVWVLWGIGAVILVGMGALLHALIAMWRRKSGGGMPPAARRLAAGTSISASR